MKQIMNPGLSTMSSKEIASVTGKQHKNVIRDIREMISELSDHGSDLSHVIERTDARGYTTEFHLDRELTLTIVSGYSLKMRHAIIVRWQELEAALAERSVAEKSRKVARLEAPHMTDAIKVNREAAGKEIRPYHFSNEFDLVNRIALGQTASKFRAHHGLDKSEPIRDHLTACQIACIEHLQRLNTSLIEIHMDFEQRKEQLNKVYLLRHKRGLMAEVLRLEA